MRASFLTQGETRSIAGVSAWVAAALSAEYAWLHARSTAALYGAICGEGPVLHCAACYAAPLFALAGAVLLVPEGLRRLRGRTAR
ncbi:MAG: hypothetical protein MH112_01940 [Phenylobacterium sp.]|uniref:hypothetical protein n=1 Tax=Phenylobacterium sp. TaxID=1871053 RepID=UPI0025D5A639|nr:hypothetical protein [Phenylobacterium sp.]MCG9915105.1 hypothetical protein [Phenylobacterium sp.]